VFNSITYREKRGWSTSAGYSRIHGKRRGGGKKKNKHVGMRLIPLTKTSTREKGNSRALLLQISARKLKKIWGEKVLERGRFEFNTNGQGQRGGDPGGVITRKTWPWKRKRTQEGGRNIVKPIGEDQKEEVKEKK